MRRACASRATPQVPRSDIALILCRGFAGTNAALIVRASIASMADAADGPWRARRARRDRCGIDSVEIARIERLIAETPRPQLCPHLFRAGARRQRRRARARREPRRALCRQGSMRQALSRASSRWGRSSPRIFPSRATPTARRTIVCGAKAQSAARTGIASLDRGIADARSHAAHRRSRWRFRRKPHVPLAGKLLYHVLPFRRAVDPRQPAPRVRRRGAGGRDRAAGAGALRASVRACSASSCAFAGCRRSAARRSVRVENVDALARALERGKGVLILTGHFGNFEVATIAGLRNFPEMHGRIHFVRRAIKPRWLDALVTRRFRRAGFGVLGKRGSLDAILERLAAGDMVVFPFDQHASPPDGIESRVLRPSGVDVQEPRDHRARDRRAGAAGGELARARRPARAALRGAGAAGRVRQRQRGNPAQHARLQRDARAPGAAPPRAMVLGASALEGRGPRK